MNKQDIKLQLEALLSNENFSEVKAGIRAIKEEAIPFIVAEEKELKAKQEASGEEKEEVDIDAENTQLNSDIKELIHQYNEKIKAEREQKDADEKANLAFKRTILEEFDALIKSEKNIGSAIAKIKEIRDKWNAVGNIPRDKYQDVQNDYSKLNDEFNYNISIYKELKENDLKRNYSLKNQIIFDLEKLKESKNMREVEISYRSLQNDWNEIGGTFQDKWEELKEKYWVNIREISDKLKAHYEAKKVEREENYNKKSALLDELKAAVENTPTSHKDWDNQTKVLLEIQKKWKKIGQTPKEKGNADWDEFREINDTFFNTKSEFYKERNTEFKSNASKKEVLIERAKKLLESNDANFATKQIVQIQESWKKIGHAGKFAEQKLWKQLRETSDQIFNAKKNAFKKTKEEESTNLKLKETVIAEIDKMKLSKDAKKAFVDLKLISDKFNAIGNIPFKSKDAIHKNFKTALDKQYTSLKLDDESREKLMFEIRLENTRGDLAEVLKTERKRTYDSISKLEEEIKQLENNMGFFNISKSAEGLFKGVEDNINDLKSKIDSLKQRLVLIKEKSSEIKKEVPIIDTAEEI